MVKKLFTLMLALAVLLFSQSAMAQEIKEKKAKKSKTEKAENKTAPEASVTIFDDVLKQAEFMKFDYKGHVDRAKRGDVSALTALFDFHRVVDGKEGLNHGITCLELIPNNDAKYAEAIREIRKDALKKLLKERVLEAQKKSSKPQFKPEMAAWAPHTWAAFNNRYVSDPAREKAKEEGKAEYKKGNAPKTIDGLKKD